MNYCKMTGTIAALLLAAGTVAVHADTLDKLKSSGTVKIGTAQEPPYAVIEPDGKLSGAALDLNKAVFEKLGVKNVTAEAIDFAGLIPGIQAKRFDVVSTGLMIRAPRCKAVLFSEPDLCTAEGFAVKKGNPLNLTSYEDLAKSTAKIAVCGGCVEEKRALEVGVPRDRLVIAADAFGAIQMLQAGRVDAVAWPDATMNSIIKTMKDDSLEVYSPVKGEPVSCSGVAFHQSDRAFRDAYDKVFAELKASGEFAEIIEPYGFDPKLVMATTREQHCGGEKN